MRTITFAAAAPRAGLAALQANAAADDWLVSHPEVEVRHLATTITAGREGDPGYHATITLVYAEPARPEVV